MRTGRSLEPIYLLGVVRFRRWNVDYDVNGKRAAACHPPAQGFDDPSHNYGPLVWAAACAASGPTFWPYRHRSFGGRRLPI
jgi:hypothetical protein